MLKNLTKTVVLACLSWTCYSQDISHATDPYHLAIANVGSSIQSPFILAYNPALLSQISPFQLASSYSNQFGVSGLNYFILEGHKKFKSTGAGLRLEQINTPHYARTLSTIGIGIPLNPKLVIGASVTNKIISISEARTTFQFLYQLGLSYYPKEGICIAGSWKSDHKNLHQLMFGGSILLTKGFTLILEHLNNQYGYHWKLGSTYDFNEILTLLSGFDLQNRTLHFGINVHTYDINLMLGFGIGHVLGTDSAIGLSYSND